MSEIYWLTRCDGINTLFTVLSVLFIIANIVFIIAYFVSKEDCGEKETSFIGSIIKVILPLMFLFIFGAILIPTTNEAYMIYGLGGTIDYLKQDSTAIELPHKVIEALNGWVNSINSN